MIHNEYTERNSLAKQELSYWKIFNIVLSRWYWIVGMLVLSYIAAKVYIAYTPQTFRSEASLKLNLDDQNAASVTAPNAFRYLRTNLIETEAQIMRSPDVILNAIEKIDYKITYYLEGKIKKSEVYPNKPFEIQILHQDAENFSRAEYEVRPVSSSTFELTENSKDGWERYNYGQIINKGDVIFKVISPIPSTGKYSFHFNSAKDFMGRALNGLSIEEGDKNSNVMNIYHTDRNPRFSADILNSIIKQYIINDEVEKRRSAKQTINFLEDRLRFIDSTVNKSGDILSNFQTENNFIDPEAEKSININKIPQLKEEINNLELKGSIINQIAAQIKNTPLYAPISLFIDASINTSIQEILTQYNNAIQTRQELLKDFKPNSSRVLDIERKLIQLKNGMNSVTQTLKNSNDQALKYLRSELVSIQNTLSAIPPIQNDFTKLSNKSEIDQKMLAMLFERRLQAQISEASIVSSAKIIHLAEASMTPIDPIPRKIYSSYLFLGLFISIGLIFATRIFNPYIYDVETIEGLTTTPIIGVILKYPKKVEDNVKKILSLSRPKSIFAESVRSVRTNLSFMGGNKPSKTVCVTSEVSGEGKSFVIVNLAGTLSIIDKKVIVIAADLRRSKMHKIFNVENRVGLSTYLSGMHTMDDIILKDNDYDFDFITSGPVPPNPSELLHSPKMKGLIEALNKKYEYILIDTAPVGLVSDAIPLIRMSDINLFILRSGVSNRRAATIPDRLVREYELNNFAIILNSFGNEKLHANIYTTNYANSSVGNYYYSDYTGYGSGYYSNHDDKKWWQFWKKK
ncbi:GumC family protein [Pedobacter flavus]|uniref:Polysaccharide biosynthesis tyrosine autokinase n=1 Tax=Pedobacter flavus TaxID=3113906 RepID=A0ABU7GXX7_9SPHI|nr:polysaccharide biosynthesis tyrosine autokinase [Pedobacter sp. VNH31]MEE1883904.1 polysaccharide biosynthesis tyrosine autokinase [Pedobacter sp. VNH31]